MSTTPLATQTCGYISGNPSSNLGCVSPYSCASTYITDQYRSSTGFGGCCSTSGSTSTCEFWTKCVNQLDLNNVCPQGGCIDTNQLSCVREASSACQTYMYTDWTPWLTSYGCGADARSWIVLLSTTGEPTFVEATASLSSVSSVATASETSTLGPPSSLTTLATAAATLVESSTSSVPSWTGKTEGRQGAPIPIIASVSSLLGSLVLLIGIGLVLTRKRRNGMAQKDDLVENAGLSRKGSQSQTTTLSQTEGLRSEIDSKEIAKKGDRGCDAGTEERSELPG